MQHSNGDERRLRSRPPVRCTREPSGGALRFQVMRDPTKLSPRPAAADAALPWAPGWYRASGAPSGKNRLVYATPPGFPPHVHRATQGSRPRINTERKVPKSPPIRSRTVCAPFPQPTRRHNVRIPRTTSPPPYGVPAHAVSYPHRGPPAEMGISPNTPVECGGRAKRRRRFGCVRGPGTPLRSAGIAGFNPKRRQRRRTPKRKLRFRATWPEELRGTVTSRGVLSA
jgi:hypothetical protein